MALRDEIRKERKEFFATATRKEKFGYIKEYYGLPIVCTILILALVAFLVFQSFHSPKVILNGTFINLYNHEQPLAVNELGEEFLKAEKINTSKYGVAFGSGINIDASDSVASYESTQALIAQVTGATIDFIVSPSDAILSLAYDEMFVDLSTVLTDEQIEYYEPYFLYVDQAIIEQLLTTDDTESLEGIELPDCRKPEEMQRPIPVLIDISEYKTITELYGSLDQTIVFGIAFNAPNTETAITFLDYLK